MAVTDSTLDAPISLESIHLAGKCFPFEFVDNHSDIDKFRMELCDRRSATLSWVACLTG